MNRINTKNCFISHSDLQKIKSYLTFDIPDDKLEELVLLIRTSFNLEAENDLDRIVETATAINYFKDSLYSTVK